MTEEENDDHTTGINIFELKNDLMMYIDVHLPYFMVKEKSELTEEIKSHLFTAQVRILEFLENKYKIKFSRPKWWLKDGS